MPLAVGIWGTERETKRRKILQLCVCGLGLCKCLAVQPYQTLGHVRA